MNEELENLGWGNDLNTPQMPDKKTKLKYKIKSLFAKPWAKSVLVSLIIVLVGLGTSYGAYYQQKQANKKKADTAVISEATTDDSTTVNQEVPISSDQTATQTSPSSSTSTGSTTAKPSSNSGSANSSSSSDSSSSTVQTKTINNGAIEFKTKSYGYCSALGPEDWSFTANSDATGADLWSPDLNFHAGWGIAFAYSYLLADDEAFLNYYLKLVYNTQNISLTSSPEDVGYGYSRRYYSGRTDRDIKGAVYYQHYDAASLGGYIMVTRFGTTESSRWDNSGALAQAAALSIRCTTQLKSSTSNSKPSNSSDSDDASVDISDKWQEAIMGYENVYNPSTGQHWEAPTSSYSSDGPQGAGYYYQNGNDLTKLSRGFGT